jgi:hypothetical protein
MSKFIAVLTHPQLKSRFELARLIDAEGVLTLELEDEKSGRIDIRFDSYFAYRKMDEGDFLTTIQDVTSQRQSIATLYEVRNSSFLEWFNKESEGVRADQSLKHFAVLCLNDIVDVIALEPPEIRNRTQLLRVVKEQ